MTCLKSKQQNNPEPEIQFCSKTVAIEKPNSGNQADTMDNTKARLLALKLAQCVKQAGEEKQQLLTKLLEQQNLIETLQQDKLVLQRQLLNLCRNYPLLNMPKDEKDTDNNSPETHEIHCSNEADNFHPTNLVTNSEANKHPQIIHKNNLINLEDIINKVKNLID